MVPGPPIGMDCQKMGEGGERTVSRSGGHLEEYGPPGAMRTYITPWIRGKGKEFNPILKCRKSGANLRQRQWLCNNGLQPPSPQPNSSTQGGGGRDA